MKKSFNKLKNIIIFLKYWRNQITDTLKLINDIPKIFGYLKDLRNYSKMEGAECIKLNNTYPYLYDKTKTIKYDAHYFYQNIWAFKKIFESKYEYHIDIGSDRNFIGFLTLFKKVTFIDIRPLIVHLDNFKSRKGNILSMPFDDDSVKSLSCLHVAEHIGLGRYGDQLDPLGTQKAAKELSRVLAPNGNLYFSLPIGEPRLCFNAHRIHSTTQILNYFSDLKLNELSGIDDNGNFIRNIDREVLDSCNYSCGLFWFSKK